MNIGRLSSTKIFVKKPRNAIRVPKNYASFGIGTDIEQVTILQN